MKAQDLVDLKQKAVGEAASAAAPSDLEAVRIKYLGRNGLLPEIMKGLKDVAPADRPEVGRLANELKNELQAAIDSRREALETASGAQKAKAFDTTLPGRWRTLGSRHPVTQIIERATSIFSTMGFTVADGPDIETEHHNFDALNTPQEHPSRDPKDTFYLASGLLLRTQTSPVQIRVMENQKPPVRIIAPGRCYRRDATDATHSANFHQIEGLYIDRQVSMADLKGDLTYFARQMMGENVQIRFRPHFFPFTEPSVEYDFSCHVCGGKGCRVCKHSGWIEISGAGMVNPKVLSNVGYNPNEVMGYAFGMGVERIAMILFGIPDIRLLYENDVRFLGQY
ncbi:MAG TPA: phenylalanine--tRNA ligase subunit alpha [Verrucomicrobia bacterium]|nr:MAG: phenylalanine--tRNA ligase subunit alpha [Lentisphaerae bacterium GWF2_57_35]HBA83440.1 phenylalanine--tRNA ligase subunit alpha [Verrucomicrobiota bacterium]